jgi:streptomycin 6-kinase
LPITAPPHPSGILDRVLTIPDTVVRIGQWGGEPGRRWLADLPGRVAELLSTWDLTLGEPYTDGFCSYAAPVRLADGTPAVLKLPFVDGENYAEARALRTYAGDGAVRLLGYAPDSGAMLLERAEPGTSLKNHPHRTDAVTVACELLTRLRRPLLPAQRDVATVPAPPLGTDMAAGIARLLRDTPAGALPPELHGPAIHWADLLAAEPQGPQLLVNRDAHLGNIRAARREPWLLIDPKPLIGEPALEAGWLLIDILTDGYDAESAARWATRVAAGLGVDEERVRAWALIRAMENAAGDTGRDRVEDCGYAAAVLPR